MNATKIFASALLTFAVACGTFTACNKKTEAKPVGALSYLNRSEEEHAEVFWKRFQTLDLLMAQGYCKSNDPDYKKTKSSQAQKVKFYDDLDSLLLALKAGEISGIDGLSQSTANYLCAKDDKLMKSFEFDLDKERDPDSFAYEAINLLSDSYSFMFLEKNEDLCNKFNEVIAELKKSGELEALVKEQIYGQMNGGEIKPLPIENVEGRETIKVAVTGSLPPMDYVASDGTFAGFNTALLSLIGKKLDKNISIVQVNSLARASALAGETVDVVFWTRGSSHLPATVITTEEERENYIKERMALHLSEENQALESMVPKASFDKYANRDIPEGTIITSPYFEDVPVLVVLKK